MKITNANPAQSHEIAKLIMMAMSDDCCLNLAGPQHSLSEFEEMMIELVQMENSQYSYQNTFIATEDDVIMGMCVGYDGARLHELRKAYLDMAKKTFGRVDPNMDDEAQADEFYIDSLAVLPGFRNQGIASQLLRKIIEKAKTLGITKVGLLVDKNNPRAEHLYTAQGFQYVDDAMWGGHPMKHLQIVNY